MSSQEAQPPQLLSDVLANPVGSLALPSGILDAILSGYTDPVCVYDQAGRHLYASAAGARLLGFTPSHMIGKTNRELGVTPEACDLIDQALNAVFTGHRPVTREISYPTMEGAREFEAVYSPIYAAAGGDVQAALAIVRDVTERNRAQRAYAQMESALRESQERFDLVQEAAGLGIWFCDLPFDKLDWNDNVKRHFGLPLDAEITIDLFYAGLHPDDRERTRRAIERSIAERSSYDIDYRTVGRDGQTRWIRAIGRAFYDAQGHPRRFDGITIDVTEHKSAAGERDRHVAEIQLLNERLRKAMAETQDLVRNNLQIVNALAEMHDVRDAESVPMRAMKRIQQQVIAMADVHELLTRSARDYGEGRQISAKALLEKLLPSLQSIDESRQIHLNLEDASLPGLMGTALAMLTNELVNNAIKHGAGDVEVTFQVEADRATLRVRDHGPGFPPNFVPRACEGTGIELVQSLAGWTLRGQVHYDNAPDGAPAPSSPSGYRTEVQAIGSRH
jgi:PAS domain S-box-containing protein